MNTTLPDLWPADIVRPRQTAPAAILRHQGDVLGQKTQNFVVREVRSSGNDGGTVFTHQFFVSAPLLDVRVPICLVEHGREFYPAKVVAFDTAENNLGRHRAEYTAAGADEFAQALRTILSQDDVKQLVQALADQCRDLTDETAA